MTFFHFFPLPPTSIHFPNHSRPARRSLPEPDFWQQMCGSCAVVLGKQVCFGGRKPLRSRAIRAAQHSLTNRWFPSTLVEKQNQPTLFDHIELSILLLLHSFAQPLWHHTRAPTFRGVVCLNYFDFVEISAFLDAQICSGACRVAARKPFTVTASKRPRMTTGMHLYIYVCICVHVCVYVYVYVCVCAYMYMYMYRYM